VWQCAWQAASCQADLSNQRTVTIYSTVDALVYPSCAIRKTLEGLGALDGSREAAE